MTKINSKILPMMRNLTLLYILFALQCLPFRQRKILYRPIRELQAHIELYI